MIFEFAGLPGCGKSTIWSEAALALKADGIPIESLRSHSRRSMLERRKSIRFLRKNAERTSLFGVVKFAEKNPETFMTLLEPDGHDTAHRLWSLELMAQLYFSGLDGHQGKAVLLDEGLIHRGMSSLATAGTAEDARAYVQTMQFEHALVLVDCSVDLSIERCRNRPGGVPGGYAMEGGHPNPEKFRNFAKLLSAAIDVLQKKDALILCLDGNRPAQELGAELATWVQMQLSPES